MATDLIKQRLGALSYGVLRFLAKFRVLASLGDSRIALVGFGLVATWSLLGLLAPWIAPFDPLALDYGALADPTPGAHHWLGTDNLGRDMLSRLLWGARTVLILVPASVVSAYIVGTLLGSLAGYLGGWVDHVISRVFDTIIAFPIIILYIILIVALGPSKVNIVLAVTFASTPFIGRIVRGLFLELRSQEYVAAAELRGEIPIYIILVEVLPNARGPLLVDFCVRLGWTIITIGVLGFLGLGLPPPDPDWGGMIKDGTQYLVIWPHMALIPALAISSLVVGFNLLADGLREIAMRD